MKKKHITILLLTTGIILLCISLIFTITTTNSRQIIGGADLSTFTFVFFYQEGGLYSVLAFFGIAAILTAVVVGVVKSKKR